LLISFCCLSNTTEFACLPACLQDRTLLEESDRAWDKISSRTYAFHALRDECTHLRVLSLQQVGRRVADR
jgi:hypothetical protein